MPSPTRLFAVVFTLAATAAGAARADDWSVTTSDFRTEAATVRGLSLAGVVVSAADGSGERVIPLDRFVSAQRPTPNGPVAAPAFTLLLAGGDRLVGQPAGATGEMLAWAEPVLGRVPVSFGRLVAIGRGTGVASPDEPPKQDVVTLANGDTVAGVFGGVADGKLTVRQADGGPVAVPLASVARVAFATPGGAAVAAGQAFRVGLADGSSVTAAGVGINGDAVTLTLPGRDARPIPIHLADVVAIEQLNGPVGWLSSRTPVESVQVPYLGGAAAWPARFDAAVDGSPLAFAGRPFGHGIGVHAYARLTFAVEGGWRSFRTQYAIDARRDDPRPLADVTVRVMLDGRVAYEQAHVRAGVLSPVVTLPLDGVRSITLVCDYGPAGDTQAHLDWLQPALLRTAASATASQPATAP